MIGDWNGGRGAARSSLHHDMAAALTNFGESLALENCANRAAG
jgi:hypothetical protein